VFIRGEATGDSFLLSGGYSSAWSGDVNGEEKQKSGKLFPERGRPEMRGNFQQRNVLLHCAPKGFCLDAKQNL
jgi:hypothetical protein